MGRTNPVFAPNLPSAGPSDLSSPGFGDDLLLQRTAPRHRLDLASIIFTPVIKYKLSGTLLIINSKNPQEIVYLDINSGVVNNSTVIFNCSAQRGLFQASFNGKIKGKFLTGILTMSGWMGSRSAKIRAEKVR